MQEVDASTENCGFRANKMKSLSLIYGSIKRTKRLLKIAVLRANKMKSLSLSIKRTKRPLKIAVLRAKLPLENGTI